MESGSIIGKRPCANREARENLNEPKVFFERMKDQANQLVDVANERDIRGMPQFFDIEVVKANIPEHSPLVQKKDRDPISNQEVMETAADVYRIYLDAVRQMNELPPMRYRDGIVNEDTQNLRQLGEVLQAGREIADVLRNTETALLVHKIQQRINTEQGEQADPDRVLEWADEQFDEALTRLWRLIQQLETISY